MTFDLIINLTASFIALVVGLFWKDRFVPWLRSFLYRGIIVKGKWRILQEEMAVDGKELAVKRETYVDLNQYADTLSGSATSIATYSDKSQDFIVYDVRGEIKDRFVSVHFKVNDSTKIAYSSFLLEVVGDGHVMKGYRAFYGFKRQEIRAISCNWVSANSKKVTNPKIIDDIKN